MCKLLLTFIFVLPISGYSKNSNLGNWLVYIDNVQVKNEKDWPGEVQHHNYSAIYFSTFNKIFSKASGNTFDRDQLYADIGYWFSKKVRLEIRNMKQFLSNTNRDQINNIAFINF